MADTQGTEQVLCGCEDYPGLDSCRAGSWCTCTCDKCVSVRADGRGFENICTCTDAGALDEVSIPAPAASAAPVEGDIFGFGAEVPNDSVAVPGPTREFRILSSGFLSVPNDHPGAIPWDTPNPQALKHENELLYRLLAMVLLKKGAAQLDLKEFNEVYGGSSLDLDLRIEHAPREGVELQVSVTMHPKRLLRDAYRTPEELGIKGVNGVDGEDDGWVPI